VVFHVTSIFSSTFKGLATLDAMKRALVFFGGPEHGVGNGGPRPIEPDIVDRGEGADDQGCQIFLDCAPAVAW